MDLNLTRADVRIAEHEARVAYAERFGVHLSAGAAVGERHRTPIAARPAVLAFARLLGAALRGLGALAVDSRDGLRSEEHELARLGIGWQADPDDDRVLADQLRVAMESRRTAQATTKGPSLLPVRSNGIAVGVVRELIGRRLSVLRHTAATHGLGPFGDEPA